MKSREKRWEVKDPWRTRVRETFHRHITCRLLGHKPITKMDGTVLCTRHD